MIDFTKYLTAGNGVWWGQAAAEPRPLVDALITHRFPIEDAVEAYRVASDKSAGARRVIVEPSS